MPSRHKWTPEETSKLMECIDQGLTPAKIQDVPLFKSVGIGAIKGQYERLKRGKKLIKGEGKAIPTNKGRSFYNNLNIKLQIFWRN